MIRLPTRRSDIDNLGGRDDRFKPFFITEKREALREWGWMKVQEEVIAPETKMPC